MVAFLGLGNMGEPMAANLVRAGTDLVVWNRSEPALARVNGLGARRASSARDALRSTSVALLMLANEAAIDKVLERFSPEFTPNVAGRLVVHMGTTSPEYSSSLGASIREAGGRYVEAPVSGSRKPAERGTLIGMAAGAEDDVAFVRRLLEPVCRETFACGEVPDALTMKLAVNLFLITMVTGLAEAAHFAANAGLDMARFRAILDAGPMASEVSKVKLGKLVNGDYSPQAGLSDVLMNSALIADAARRLQIASPLLDQSHRLFAQADDKGFGRLDMVGVIHAIEERTSAGKRSLAPAGE